MQRERKRERDERRKCRVDELDGVVKRNGDKLVQ